MAAYLTFDKGSPEHTKLLEWWRDLEKDRGGRAELRRSKSLTEIALLPAYHRLRLSILHLEDYEGIKGIQEEGLMLVAGLAARVKTNNDVMNIAEQMAASEAGGNTAVVSDLRFRRLLKANKGEELYMLMTRAISLLGSSVDLQSLAKSVYWWNDRTKKDWAYSYYTKAPAKKA